MRTAKMFAPSLFDDEPRMRVVYSREDFSNIPLPDHVAQYPELRYMGSKHRLLPWIHGVLSKLPFETAADPFVGSGCVAYLLKAMGKRVVASDFLNFPAVLAKATVANSKYRLDGPALKTLLAPRPNGPHFIQQTFDGIFYTTEDLPRLRKPGATRSPLPASARARGTHPLLPQEAASRGLHRLGQSLPLRRRPARSAALHRGTLPRADGSL
ncbi:MAG: DNA adenine methylase [Bryobacterales bacterium]|nr:DNA adenine methylase [Bryobacterales bacterium]